MYDSINIQDLLLIRRALESYYESLKDNSLSENVKNEAERVRTLYDKIGEMKV